MNRFKLKQPLLRKGQKGAVTMFSAVMILILLTEMIIYSVQVGVFEQRKSSNETRQKLAFHAADSAIQQAKQFMLANSILASSDVNDLLPNGTDGWLSTDGLRWKPCSGISGTTGTHPCFGEPVPALRANTYYYEFGGSTSLPLDPDAFSTSNNEKVTLNALLCMLDIDRTQDPIVQGCTTAAALQDGRYFMITLLARGEADCDNNSANCTAEALVSEKIGSFGPGGGDGGPGVPLTARTSVPLKGTVEIVPNPNGGGVGVPISTWANNNPIGSECYLGVDAVSPDSGSYSTCERHEWYAQDSFPSDYKCPTATCECKKGTDRLLSFADGNERILGMDIVLDDDFPCDLWAYSFGITKVNYLQVKDLVPPAHRLTSCDSLDENSFGMYWISGSACDMKTQIGSAKAPVFLISAVSNTKVNAGASVFGVLFVTDVEDSAAEFTGNGRATIYGAAVMDAKMEHFNGTFQIVYLEDIIGLATATGGFGAVAGGWTDFHSTWQ